MASISKRQTKTGAIRYQAMVRLRGHPPIVATFDSRSDARKWAAEKEADIRRGRHFSPERGNHTLSDAIDRYLASRNFRSLKNGENYRQHLTWWRQQLGDHRLADIRPGLVRERREQLLTKPIRKGSKRTVGETTANRYVSSLSACLSYAVTELEWLEENPIHRMQRFRESAGRVRYLSQEELKRLLSECRSKKNRNPDLYLMVMLAVSTGMRKSEMLRLQWRDVDLNRRTILLRVTKNGEQRTVPIVGDVVELLAHKRKKRMDSLLLFPGDADPTKPINPRKAFDAAVKRARIGDFRFHDLRHTAASYLAMSGSTEREIAEVLGHKTMQMVKRYSHLSTEHTAKVVERMSQQFLETKSS